jgi:hypothetical protein
MRTTSTPNWLAAFGLMGGYCALTIAVSTERAASAGTTVEYKDTRCNCYISSIQCPAERDCNPAVPCTTGWCHYCESATNSSRCTQPHHQGYCSGSDTATCVWDYGDTCGAKSDCETRAPVTDADGNAVDCADTQNMCSQPWADAEPLPEDPSDPAL